MRYIPGIRAFHHGADLFQARQPCAGPTPLISNIYSSDIHRIRFHGVLTTEILLAMGNKYITSSELVK